MTNGLKWHKDKRTGKRVYLGLHIPTCHPEKGTKGYRAKGLCHACYMRQHHRANGINPRPPKKKALCHPDRPHAARGMCMRCYTAWYNHEHYVKTQRESDHIRVKEGSEPCSDYLKGWSNRGKEGKALDAYIKRKGLALNSGTRGLRRQIMPHFESDWDGEIAA